MTYLLDTNVLIAMRDNDLTIMDRVADLNGDVLMSIISQVELEGGVYRDPSDQINRRNRLEEILNDLNVLPFGNEAARAYGTIVAVAGYSRRKIIDRMIAAQAIVSNATLVTMNARDFEDIPVLKLSGWDADQR